MLPFFLKRLFWIVPTLVAVSIATFYFLSFVPVDASVGSADALASDDARGARFLDLPRFVNVAPRDVRARAKQAASDVASGGERAPNGARELVRLGAAALPYVIPSLDAFGPNERTRVAVALAPLAERMHVPNAADARDPAKAVTFWTRFWDDRGVEFQKSSVRTAVERLARYRSEGRASELEELDTFALDEIMNHLAPPTRDDQISAVRALVEVLSHVTGRDDALPEQATLADARACVMRWQRYWFVHSSEFVALDGTARASALVLETRYGKWAHSVVSAISGDAPSPALERLRDGAGPTLAIMFGAIALAYGSAIVLGLLSAAVKKKTADVWIGLVLLGMYAVPTALVALAARRLFGPMHGLVLPILVVAVALVAAPARHTRSALLGIMTSDYVRAARARGATTFRSLVVHGLRMALVPIVTLATLEPPMALGATFVAERVFAVRGLGEMTIAAVNQRDVDFLMGLALALAALASLLIVANDIGHAILDPRVRHRLTRGRA